MPLRDSFSMSKTGSGWFPSRLYALRTACHCQIRLYSFRAIPLNAIKNMQIKAQTP